MTVSLTEVTQADVAHWVVSDSSTLHYLVRASGFAGRAACAEVLRIQPGCASDESHIQRCEKCADAVASAQENLPTDVEDLQSIIVDRLIAGLPKTLKPHWESIKDSTYVPRYVGDDEENEQNGGHKLPKYNATHSTPKRTRSHSEDTVTETATTESAETEPFIVELTETLTDAAAKLADPPKPKRSHHKKVAADGTQATTPKDKPSTRSTPKSTKQADPPKPKTAAAKPAAKAVAPKTAAARPAAKPAAKTNRTATPPVDPAGKSSKDWYAEWKRENEKLLKMDPSDPRRDKQYRKMRDASKGYRAAKALEKGAA